jgi:hypothetical protein
MPELTLATVNLGAIVMAPFDQNCRAEGLGACAGQRARVLSADMSGLALVYRIGTADPGFQTAPGGHGRESSKFQPPDSSQKETAERANAVRSEQLRPEDTVNRSRLIWGRWATVPGPGDTLTVAFRDAMRGNEVTVGDGYFFLFREPSSLNLLPSLSQQASFKLGASSAFHQLSSNELAPASVDRGQLVVNFSQRSYSTSLQLSADGIAPQSVRFSGTLDPSTGIFLGGDPKSQTSLAGSFSLDGLQAGYLFRFPVGLGSLLGATLWSR